IDTTNYLAPTSDIVALMVLEHQITAHNAITRAHFNTRRWLHQNAVLAEHFGTASDELSDSTRRLIAKEADRLLAVMLFKDEAPLEDWGVEGDERFQTAFLKGARHTADGQSLRDFNLMSRLFKNRLSYMIHSRAFDNLPSEFTEVFFRKLRAELAGEQTDVSAHLSAIERKRILAILRETNTEAPRPGATEVEKSRS
ncbi:MAG: hypothetical protein MI923_17430, partial [Phycisphaerales bacterium]|nr:hypothetical protein [Phycisphaerales bacterium]